MSTLNDQSEWIDEGQFAGPVSGNGRLRAYGLSDTERHVAVAIHLSPIIGMLVFPPVAFVAPLVLWLIRKDHSPFNDDHGREVVNFMLSFLVLHLLAAVVCITIIGIPFAILGVLILWVAALIGIIRGALAAGRGEFFRYPMTIRFLG